MSEPLSTLSGHNAPAIDPEAMLRHIVTWVEIETPSTDVAAVNRLVDKVEGEAKATGARVERWRGREDYGDALIIRSPWGGDGPGVVLIGHLDTVHPIGTKDRLTITRDGDRMYGPGIYDMKAGSYLALFAMDHFIRTGQETPLPLTVLLLPDEEVGSPSARPLIEEVAGSAKYCLVTEPCRDGGKVVTARKGCGRYVITARGKPAHSGARHQDGVSAIAELARVALKIEALTDYDRGITTNVGLMTGGTAANVVPEHASMEVDARFPTAETAVEVDDVIQALTAENPDVTLTIEGGINRPGYEKNDGIQALFDLASEVALEQGLVLEEVHSGGFSDGNYPAAMGVPTLDGLGVDGSGAHTEEEYMLVSSIEPRAKLLIRLIERLR